MNTYRVLTAIGWRGKTLPAGRTLQATDEEVAVLLERGLVQLIAPAIPAGPAITQEQAKQEIQHLADEHNQDLPAAGPILAPGSRPLEALTVAELTELAVAENIDLLGVKKKAGIIELIVGRRMALMDARSQGDADVQEDAAEGTDKQEGNE